MSDVLDKARALVEGGRQAAYGHPIDNYTRLAAVLSVILNKEITPMDCMRIFVAVKLVRDCNAMKEDNWIDIAGYCKVAEMIVDKQGGWPDRSDL